MTCARATESERPLDITDQTPPLFEQASMTGPGTDSMEWCISVTPGDVIRTGMTAAAVVLAPVLLYTLRKLMRSGSHR